MDTQANSKPTNGKVRGIRLAPISCKSLSLLIAISIGGSLGAQDPPVAPGSTTLIHFPDTQNYVSNSNGVGILNKQMEWVRANRAVRNICFGVQVGDLVNDNSSLQWARSRTAFDLLMGEIPYALSTGNHDCGPSGSGETRATAFTQSSHFGIGSAYHAQPTLRGIFHHPDDPPGNTQNTWHSFKMGRQDFLVLTCEWGPRDQVVAWMNSIVTAHPFHRAILVCHAYLASGTSRYDWSQSQSSMNPHSFGIHADPDKTNDGQELWDKLVKRHENFCMVCCGHAGRGFRTVTGTHGNKVHEMLFNTQDLANGGDGWVRLLEFLPDGRTVQARTYSTHQEEWDHSAAGAFRFTLSEVSRTDSDSDGMPDYFEWQNGWSVFSPANAAEDADHDGFTNYHEFAARTSPLDAASHLTITAVTSTALGQVTVQWSSIPGMKYLVQESDNPGASTGWENVGGLVEALDHRSQSLIALNGSRKFFRITAVR